MNDYDNLLTNSIVKDNSEIKKDKEIMDKIELIIKKTNSSVLDSLFYKDMIIKLLSNLKRDQKLMMISEDFIKDTVWFSGDYNSYSKALYAIFYKKDYYNENSDDYLYTITDIILRSVNGNLYMYGNNYDKYFIEFNKILELYSISHVFLNRDKEKKIITNLEHHFFEIILATFLSYYYLNCENISLEKIINTIKDIFNYHEFMEQWQIRGIKNLDSYDKEKLIAKTLIDNISLPKKRIK